MSGPTPDLAARLHRLHRQVVGLQLDMAILLGHFGLPGATAEQIDAALDEQ